VIAHRDGLAFTLEAPALLDIGAAGKGYLIDHIAALLETNAIREYIIDGSGDIITKGDISEVVGLEDPLNTDSVIGEIDLQNEALCASAVNRRAWGEGMHHIIDPETGEPSRQVIATWVITDSAMVADGLATALFFTDPHRLETEYTYEYMRIKADHSIEYSRRFEAALYKG
jgi:thiamine biosynthesis lipoprotein